ncbi:GIY-YIG nuclease family protein [Lysinibacillus xylanilyticus]|uniref:GIY-YIG nuclease family protein n=1 Tax=Lysinibacillus xylanilyticus TaxID=582475 RepID=UPI003827E050
MSANNKFTFKELLKSEKIRIEPEEVGIIWHNKENLQGAIKDNKRPEVIDLDTYTAHQPKENHPTNKYRRETLKRKYLAVFIKEENEKARFYKFFDNDCESQTDAVLEHHRILSLSHNKTLEFYENKLIVEWGGSRQNDWAKLADEKELPISALLERPRGEFVFEGFENVKLSWYDLGKVLQLPEWQTALSNQKAVYLQTDKLTNKHYVGSATGGDSLLGRWKSYVENGHGGNKGLRSLDFDYIKENFEYSILEVFPGKIDDNKIIAREQWWKKILQSTEEEFGYNKN